MTTQRAGHIAGFSFRWRPRAAVAAVLAAFLLAALCVVSVMTGSSGFGPDEVLGLLGPDPDSGVMRIVSGIRMPRMITGVCVGAALAISGAMFQSLSRNALGSPDIIGFITGAATGAIIAITMFQATAVVVAISAVVAGVLTAIIVLVLSAGGTEAAGYRLILVGIGVGALLAAVNTTLLTRTATDAAIAAQVWLTGTLNARTWAQAYTMLIALIVLLPLAVVLARSLTAMDSGDDLAAGLGVRVAATRRAAVCVAVALAAVATAVCGPISFVALAAPHIARGISGTRSVQIILSGLCGAALLTAADIASQTLPLGLRAPVALVTGLFGGVYLIWLLTRSRHL